MGSAHIQVTASNKATAAEYSTQSGPNGMFQLPLLPAGRYTLDAACEGFQKLRRDDLVVNATEIVRLDLVFQLGAV